MPQIKIDVHRNGIERLSNAVFDPGPLEILLTGTTGVTGYWFMPKPGSDIPERVEDPGLTLAQYEAISKLRRGGVSLVVDEDGKVSVCEE